MLLAQPARGVLLSLPAVAAAGFSPDEPEDFPSSRGGTSAPEFDDEEEFDEELDQEEAGDVWEDRLERFVTRALNLTKGHGGECAVGTGEPSVVHVDAFIDSLMTGPTEHSTVAINTVSNALI